MANLPWGSSPWSTGGAPTPATASPPRSFNTPQAGAQSAMDTARSAASAANPYNGKTPAQVADMQRFSAMTPEQRAAYTTGQGQAQISASAAANRAGISQAALVGPGGPLSQNPNDVRQRAADSAGLDMMKPGVNERFIGAHGNDLMTGGPSSQFWSGYGTDLMAPGNSQKAYDDAMANRPAMPSANLDPYYDRAEQNATTKLSAAQAARGAYGSSVGVGQVGSMLADLEAQRVKDEADYGLKRSDLDRNWMTARGDLAGQADRDAVSRWTATGSGAATADQSAIDRWRTTQQGAESAQGSQRTRGQDLFTNNLNMGNALAGPVGTSFEQGSVQDQGIMDAIIKLGLAKDAAGVADVMAQMKSDEALSQKVMDAVKYVDTKNSEDKKA